MAVDVRCAICFLLVIAAVCCIRGSNVEPKIVYLTEVPTLYKDVSSVDVLALNITINVSINAVDISSIDTFALQQLLCQLVSHGAIAFAADISCEKMKFVASVLETMEVPLINIANGCTESESYNNFFNYFDSKSDIMVILSDVMHMLNVRSNDWKDFIVVYDNDSAAQLNTVNGVLFEHNVTAQSFKIENKGDVDRILKYVEKQRGVISKFLLLCNTERILEIFKQANQYDRNNDVQGLFTYIAQWLIIARNSSDLKIIEAEVQTLDHVTAVIDNDDQNLKPIDVLQDVVNLVLPAVSMYSGTNISETNSSSSNCGQQLLLTQNVLAQFKDSFSDGPCMNCTEYVLMSAFYVEGRNRQFQKVAEWTREESKAYGKVFPNVEFGLNRRFFSTSTLEWDPFVIGNANTSTGFEGLCTDLLEELAQNLNFTYNITRPPDGEWGSTDNGSITGWTGLVGVLERKEMDMTVAPLGANIDREHVMDFTEAFYLEYQTVLVRYKNSESDKWRLYLEPFQWQAWLSFIAAIPVGALAIWIVTRLTPYYECHGEESEKKAKDGLGKIENAMFFSFGAFFQQGSIWLPDSQSGRFIVGFWWMYCIVVMATYSGNLIAYLTVTKTTLPFDTVTDMLNQNKFKFGTLGGTLTEFQFKRATDGNDKRIWEKISDWRKDDPTVLSTNHSHHIEKAITENYAYIQDRTSFEILTSKRCDIGIINENFQPMEYSIGLQNNSYFEKVFSLEIIKIRETGLLNKWKVRWWPRQSFCSTGTQTIAKAVSLTDVQGAYYAMGILLAFAIIALLCETILHFSKARKMTGKHSGNYKNDSHTIQMENKNGHNDFIPTAIDKWPGFQSINNGTTHINEYGGMFESNSQTQLTLNTM